MKFTSILVLIAIVFGIIWFNMPPKEAEAPTNSAPVEEKINEISQTNDHGMTAEEHEAMMGESVDGTDVGMEMPIADTVQGMDHSGMDMGVNPDAKVFMVHGSNFSYDVKEIRVKEGDTVTINFMSTDGFHDWVLDEFDAKSEKIRTGGMSSVTFVATRKGTFEYYCSVGSHRANGMVGNLIVE